MTDYKMKVFNTEGTEYSSCNIEYSENGEEKCIRDVSGDIDAVAEFVDKLNRTDTDPVNIRELIDDFLAAL